MADAFNLLPTTDGSFTFYSPEFDEAFHSYSGARLESQQKFVAPCRIAELARRNSLKILDICYGLGYNSAEALATVWAINPTCHVELIGLEANAAVPRQAAEHQLLAKWRQAPYPPIGDLEALSKFHQVNREHLQARLLIGDARRTIRQCGVGQADVIFLDPFSPPKCPQLWTVEFLSLVAQCLAPEGRLATYSCAASVRTALKLAGLHFGPTHGAGRKSPGTIASFTKSSGSAPLPEGGVLTSCRIPPLSLQEQEHLLTRAAVPYRDPHLQDSLEKILQRRQQEQQQSCLEPTSHWKKRWRKRAARLVAPADEQD